MHEVCHVFANMYEFFDQKIQLVQMLLLVYMTIVLIRIKNKIGNDKQ